MAWRRPTGRASATSSGRWSSGWKSHVTRSMSWFGSTHSRVITILKKKVCNFVGGEPCPIIPNFASQSRKFILHQIHQHLGARIYPIDPCTDKLEKSHNILYPAERM